MDVLLPACVIVFNAHSLFLSLRYYLRPTTAAWIVNLVVLHLQLLFFAPVLANKEISSKRISPSPVFSVGRAVLLLIGWALRASSIIRHHVHHHHKMCGCFSTATWVLAGLHHLFVFALSFRHELRIFPLHTVYRATSTLRCVTILTIQQFNRLQAGAGTIQT